MAPVLYDSTRYEISSAVSSPPSRFLWIKSTVRMKNKHLGYHIRMKKSKINAGDVGFRMSDIGCIRDVVGKPGPSFGRSDYRRQAMARIKTKSPACPQPLAKSRLILPGDCKCHGTDLGFRLLARQVVRRPFTR